MSFARDEYTASGGQTDFTISFPYLDEDHIEVYVEGVLKTVTTDYTIVGGTTVRFGSGQTATDVVVILRNSSQTARLVDYEVPSTLTETELDEDSQQAFYLAQEALDQAAEKLGANHDGEWDAGSNKIINVTDPTNAQDAATKAYVDAAGGGGGGVSDHGALTGLADNDHPQYGLTATDLSQFAATTSAQLAGVISDETGSGALVFATSPTFVTPALGTPASGVATNLTGTAAGLTAGNVTTNANLTGHVTSVGNAAVLGSFTLAQLNAAISDGDVLDDGNIALTTGTLAQFAATSSAQLAGVINNETGTGQLVFGTNPTLTAATMAGNLDLDNNHIQIGTSGKILDNAAATILSFTHIASAVNYLDVIHNTTGNDVGLGANGSDAAVSLDLTTKGAGVVKANGSQVTTVSSKLSAFAATTSAELAGVISDETGSGALVFGTSPTLTGATMAGDLAMGANDITGGGDFIATHASGPQLVNTGGNNAITIRPDRSATTTGFGEAATIVRIWSAGVLVGEVREASFTALNSASSATFLMKRTTATPGNGAVAALLQGQAENAAGAQHAFAEFDFVIVSDTDMAEEGKIRLKVISAGTPSTTVCEVDSSGLNMLANTITAAGNILADSAGGPSIQDVTASATIPSLIPDRADLTTGWGGTSGGGGAIYGVLSGVERLALTNGALTYFKNAGITSMILDRTDTHGSAVVANSLTFRGKDHLGNVHDYGKFQCRVVVDTDGSETGSLEFRASEVSTGHVLYFAADGSAGTVTFEKPLDMNANNITSAGDYLTNDANGGAVMDEPASLTNPTLVPDRSELNTGIGYNSGTGVLGFMVGGVTTFNSNVLGSKFFRNAGAVQVESHRDAAMAGAGQVGYYLWSGEDTLGTSDLSHFQINVKARATLLASADGRADFQVMESGTPNVDYMYIDGENAQIRILKELQLDADLNHDGTNVGFYAATPVAQHTATGVTAGFTAGSGTSANDDSTYTGNTGTKAYTVSDIVAALKNLGLMAAS